MLTFRGISESYFYVKTSQMIDLWKLRDLYFDDGRKMMQNRFINIRKLARIRIKIGRIKQTVGN